MCDEMIRELKDVRYVSQMKKNLISIGALETRGLKRIFGDDVLKILKSAMVVMNGIRRNNLYYLKGNTVKGQVAASEGIDNNSIRLWHMRLGHTGEKFLQALAK